MKDEFDKVHQKLDIMSEKIYNIDLTLVRQEGSLKEHMKRSQANEESVELLRQEIVPVKSHVEFINNISKFIIVSGSIILFLKEMNWLSAILKFFLS